MGLVNRLVGIAQGRFRRWIRPSASVAEPRVGDVLPGGYRIVRPLDEGGMALLFEADQVDTKDRFAVKVLRHSFWHNQDIRTRFECEALILDELRHENIVAIHDYRGVEGAMPYMVMEYLRGENLFEILRREGRLPLSRALDLIQQACHGLAAAHAAGIVHRDIKPDNLFVCSRANGTELVKIIDFGIAKMITADPGSRIARLGERDGCNFLGTPDYTAPEQVSMPCAVDGRADLYGLGVILFESLTGRLPYPPGSFATCIDDLATRRPCRIEALRPDFPPAFGATVHRALAFDRRDRFRCALDLADALEAFRASGEAPWATRGEGEGASQLRTA